MNLSSFDLNLLRVLDALLQEGSTIRAGARVGLSQPAVSAALKRLRLSLGDDLFIRQGQRLEPTAFARSLAIPLRDTLDGLEQLLSGPDRFDPATATGRFRLSGSDFFAELLMPQLGAHLAATAPGLNVHLVDLVPDNYVDTLDTYAVDIALVPRPDLPSWIEWQQLHRTRFDVIARRGHPEPARLGLAPDDTLPLDSFCALSHVAFSVEGGTHLMGDAALARIGRRRRVAMTLPSFYSVHSVVAGSDHIALVPCQMAETLRRRLDIEIYRAPLPVPSPALGMIWHRRFSNLPAHRWLRDQIAMLMAPLDVPSPIDTGDRPT